jgi:transposase
MREPQEIEEREHEVAVARVAAVDVAKAAGVVCTRVPREPGAGRFVTKVWTVDATTNAILELADHLVGLRIEKVVLESTSDYWRPFFCLQEAAGVNVELVNARDVKNAPGRPKTGKLDAVWLAKLAGWGMLRPSFGHRPRSASCGTIRGCGLIWSGSGRGIGSGWRSCGPRWWRR